MSDELVSNERPLSTLEESISYPLPADVYLQVLDRSKIPFVMSHLLRGESYNPDNGTWVESGKALANPEGIRTIITIINSYVGIDKIATNLPEEKVIEMCFHLRRVLTEKLYQNWKKFAIDKSDMSIILNLIMDTVDCNLRGSTDATIQNLLKHTAERREIIQPTASKHWWESLPLVGSRR